MTWLAWTRRLRREQTCPLSEDSWHLHYPEHLDLSSSEVPLAGPVSPRTKGLVAARGRPACFHCHECTDLAAVDLRPVKAQWVGLAVSPLCRARSASGQCRCFTPGRMCDRCDRPNPLRLAPQCLQVSYRRRLDRSRSASRSQKH